MGRTTCGERSRTMPLPPGSSGWPFRCLGEGSCLSRAVVQTRGNARRCANLFGLLTKPRSGKLSHTDRRGAVRQPAPQRRGARASARPGKQRFAPTAGALITRDSIQPGFCWELFGLRVAQTRSRNRAYERVIRCFRERMMRPSPAKARPLPMRMPAARNAKKSPGLYA